MASSPPLALASLLVIGRGKQGTVYDVGDGTVLKVFDRGSAKQRLRGSVDHLLFLVHNRHNSRCPSMIGNGVMPNGDPYLCMEKLPDGLVQVKRPNIAVVQAAETLLPRDKVWTDVFGNAWRHPATGAIYFNEGGSCSTKYNGTYHTLSGL